MSENTCPTCGGRKDDPLTGCLGTFTDPFHSQSGVRERCPKCGGIAGWDDGAIRCTNLTCRWVKPPSGVSGKEALEARFARLHSRLGYDERCADDLIAIQNEVERLQRERPRIPSNGHAMLDLMDEARDSREEAVTLRSEIERRDAVIEAALVLAEATLVGKRREFRDEKARLVINLAALKDPQPNEEVEG